MARVSWKDLKSTGERDCYGDIMVQKGRSKEGILLFRRRRRNNKTRYMFWSEKGKIYSADFDSVLLEARALLEKGK